MLIQELSTGGNNIFLTGPAGTGKSYLLHEIIALPADTTFITASTGVASCKS